MSVEELVTREPWRRGSGQPINALDPTWNIKRSIPCDGEIAFEDGTRWWWCKRCGYCGKHTFHQHVPIQDPLTFMLERIQDYMNKRVAEGVTREAAIHQMMQLAGTVIGYGSVIKTEDLRFYLDQLRIR